MAEIRLVGGLNPADPASVVVAVVVEHDGPPAERAVALLGQLSHEVDGAWYLLPTDGWAERHYEDGWLTVDLCAYPESFRSDAVDTDAFEQLADTEPRAVRLLRVRTEAAPEAVARAVRPTAVITTAAGTPADTAVRELIAGTAEPLILGPARSA
ncbi:hypothetical protein ACF9IK_00590 [Kitasatospora hibisci]|uniref:hypothetical protein n=1 Tax=Kitasatospora hibisci TaxID=3369522 RepID=UPI003754CEB2